MFFLLGGSLYSIFFIVVKCLYDRNCFGKYVFILVVLMICYFIVLFVGEINVWLFGLLMLMLIGMIVFLEWGFFVSFL